MEVVVVVVVVVVMRATGGGGLSMVAAMGVEAGVQFAKANKPVKNGYTDTGVTLITAKPAAGVPSQGVSSSGVSSSSSSSSSSGW